MAPTFNAPKCFQERQDPVNVKDFKVFHKLGSSTRSIMKLVTKSDRDSGRLRLKACHYHFQKTSFPAAESCGISNESCGLGDDFLLGCGRCASWGNAMMIGFVTTPSNFGCFLPPLALPHHNYDYFLGREHPCRQRKGIFSTGHGKEFRGGARKGILWVLRVGV